MRESPHSLHCPPAAHRLSQWLLAAVLLLCGCTPNGTYYLVDAQTGRPVAGATAQLLQDPDHGAQRPSLGLPWIVTETTTSDSSGKVVFAQWRISDRAEFYAQSYNPAKAYLTVAGGEDIFIQFGLALAKDYQRGGEIRLEHPSSVKAAKRDALTREVERTLRYADPAKLDAWTATPDTGIALFAAWGRLLSAPRINAGDKPQALAPRAIERFLGFVEGRVGVAPPAFWKDALLQARPAGAHRVSFSFASAATLTDIAADPASPRVTSYVPPWSVEWGGYTWTVVPNEAPPPSRWEAPQPAPGSALWQAVGTSDEEAVFLCVFSNTVPQLFLAGFDLSGVHRWVQPMWIRDTSEAALGPVQLSMQIHGDQVIVFAAKPDAIAINAFAKTTGKPLYRFSTEFMRFIPEPPVTPSRFIWPDFPRQNPAFPKPQTPDFNNFGAQPDIYGQ